MVKKKLKEILEARRIEISVVDFMNTSERLNIILNGIPQDLKSCIVEKYSINFPLTQETITQLLIECMLKSYTKFCYSSDCGVGADTGGVDFSNPGGGPVVQDGGLIIVEPKAGAKADVPTGSKRVGSKRAGGCKNSN